MILRENKNSNSWIILESWMKWRIKDKAQAEKLLIMTLSTTTGKSNLKIRKSKGKQNNLRKTPNMISMLQNHIAVSLTASIVKLNPLTKHVNGMEQMDSVRVKRNLALNQIHLQLYLIFF